jgi:hypothetical protein
MGMRVVEEPFTTRDAILAVLRPGKIPSEGPFRTLRQKNFASPGIRIDVRSSLGRVLGRAHLYSSLNADAARAVRLHQEDLANSLVVRAGEIERSPPAQTVLKAIRQAASAVNIEAPNGALRRYLCQRRHPADLVLDPAALARDWLVHPAAWLDDDTRDEVLEAVTMLAQEATEARHELIGDAFQASTYFGTVRRMDSTAAEIEGDDGAVLLPRRDLERHGLAVLGQAVALLTESLPAGGTLTLPMPAISLMPPLGTRIGSPWDVEDLDDGATPASLLSAADHAWLGRTLAREPTAVPAAPLAGT